jgi:protein gp37
MADNTKIEWSDATWNVITGCSVASASCRRCYAMKLAGTRLQHHPSRAGLTQDTPAGPVWTGEVRFNEDWLLQPLAWRRPRRIFVCAHGDLFHENVPDEWIDRVFAVMALAPHHTFQVLTKRAERMLDYLRCGGGSCINVGIRQAIERMGHPDIGAVDKALPNVWLGVSVEDQAAADKRVPLLLQTPAAVRWISAEPLLGPVDLSAEYLAIKCGGRYPFKGLPKEHRTTLVDLLDWVVVGGESGANARPMSPTWARSLRDQCAAAGVPFLFKQWGEWLPMLGQAEGVPVKQKAETPDGWVVGWAGKKAAGRLLDGIQHDGYPQEAS